MARIVMVAYRPFDQKREAVLGLLREQHLLVRRLGLMGGRHPWLMEGVNGEIVYIAAFNDARQVDQCWENEDFQDLDSRLAQVAHMIPLRNLQEASSSYVDMAALATEPPET